MSETTRTAPDTTTAGDVCAALHRRYNKPSQGREGEQYVVIEQARAGAGFDGNAGQCKPQAVVEDDDMTGAWLKGNVTVDHLRKAFGEDSDEWPEVWKSSTKVYVGPFRKLVRVGEEDDGYDLRVVLACGHVQTSVVALVDDLAIPSRGEVLTCRECPPDPIEGDARSAADLIVLDARKRPVVVAPDGEEVPGVVVRPGGVTAKATAR